MLHPEHPPQSLLALQLHPHGYVLQHPAVIFPKWVGVLKIEVPQGPIFFWVFPMSNDPLDAAQ